MQCVAEELSDRLCTEITELVTDYYDKTNAHVGLPPYSFDWGQYQYLNSIGQLFTLTMRDEKQLVGVAMYIIAEHPHHKGRMMAECDTLATRLGQRGKGIGRILCEAAQSRLRGLGVNAIVHRFRTCYTEKPLFEQLGFTCAEHVYVKEL